MKTTCPFCEQTVELFKHVGRCNAAMIELDPNLKAQADHLRNLPDSGVEAVIQQTMEQYQAMFVLKAKRQPTDIELAHIRSQVADNLRRIRGR